MGGRCESTIHFLGNKEGEDPSIQVSSEKDLKGATALDVCLMVEVVYGQPPEDVIFMS